MAKRVTPDQFQSAVMEALKEYRDEVNEGARQVTRAVVKQGAQQAKAASGIWGGTGKYARGWTSQVDEGYLTAEGVVYNRNTPGLPHLLEHGHAKRGGGRWDGTSHLADVEKEMIEAFEKALEAKL